MPSPKPKLKKESTRKLLSPGWRDGEITEALEKASKRGNDMIEITVMMRDAQGNEERPLRDWLTKYASRRFQAASRLRSGRGLGSL